MLALIYLSVCLFVSGGIYDWVPARHLYVILPLDQVMRRKGNLGALSGADGSRYVEYDSRPPKKHPLFKSRYVKLK